MRKPLAIDEAWREKIQARHIPTLARSLTAIERDPDFAVRLASEVFTRCNGFCLGITGAPGAGKSSLVNRLIEVYRRRELTVAVLAVDPASVSTGGAVLGDRIRMEDHVLDSGVYLRSLSTRGHLGGLSQSTLLMAQLLKYAGFDRVIIETVGIGQSELDIVRVADLTALVFIPGMGDQVQAIKSGVMEIGDIFILNKSDHPGIQALAKIARDEAHDRARKQGVETPIQITNAVSGEGIEALIDAIEDVAGKKASHQNLSGDNQRLLIFADQLLDTYINNQLKQRFLKGEEFTQFRQGLQIAQQSPADIIPVFEQFLHDYQTGGKQAS